MREGRGVGFIFIFQESNYFHSFKASTKGQKDQTYIVINNKLINTTMVLKTEHYGGLKATPPS